MNPTSRFFEFISDGTSKTFIQTGDISQKVHSMSRAPVLLDVVNRIATIKFNNPAKLNALTVTTGEAFAEAVEDIKQRDDVSAVIVTGEGKAFSAGGDLSFLRARTLDTPDSNSAEMLRFCEFVFHLNLSG